MADNKRKQSDVWDHYIINENDEYYVVCNYCRKKISNHVLSNKLFDLFETHLRFYGLLKE